MIVHDTFAKIEHIDDLLNVIGDKDEIRVKEESGYKIVSYMIADNSTFNSLEALECRGITFYPDGTIAARSLHKFFNLGEKEETFEENLPAPENVMKITDKEDGSMVHPVIWHDDTVIFKTKKSFYSDVAQEVNRFVSGSEQNSRKSNIIHFCYEMLTLGYTPIFEYVAPSNRIVLKYDEPDLRLIAIRENVSGRYVDDGTRLDYAQKFDLSVESNDNKDRDYWDYETWNELKEELKEKEYIEGVVAQFWNGEMIKIKTPWYQQLHKAMSYSRERDIAEMVLDETIDDHKAMLHEMGEDLSKVEEIEHRVIEQLNHIRDSVEREYDKHKDLDRKTFALKMKGHYLFSLIMKRYTGQEPDYVGWFKKNRLKNFSLETVI